MTGALEGDKHMTNIICANSLCKYNNDKNVCTAKTVEMSWHSVMTVHDGRQEFLKCKTYEMDERSKEIENQFMNLFMKHPL